MDARLTPFLSPRTPRDATLWELFHENSKTSRFDNFPAPEAITQQMDKMLLSLNYDQYPRIDLPDRPATLDAGLGEVIAGRVTGRGMRPSRLGFPEVAALLEAGYGVTRDNAGTIFPRPFRAVPSGGALYPLELYFHTTRVDELEAGLYHYNPSRRCLRFLSYGDESRKLSEALIQRELAVDASLIVFVTALFDRSVFKYGERGYRFALIEAGHVGQNIALAACALGLACTPIGGYADRKIDDMLGLDGTAQSTVYMLAIGEPVPDGEAERPAIGH